MNKVFASAVAAAYLLAGTLFAQTPLQFEVASIKPAIPFIQQAQAGSIHAGMSVDGARVDIGATAVGELIAQAYEVKSYQVQGPAWLTASPGTIERFDILAKMPAGATKEQVPEMLRGLLADRFKLAVHKSSKDQDIYALVEAKGGHKMKPSEEEAVAEGDKKAGAGNTFVVGGNTVKQGPNGTEVRTSSANGKMVTRIEGDKMTLEASKMSVSQLVEAISRFLDKPAVDMTNLKGDFQMTLVLSMQDVMRMAQAMGAQVPGRGGDPSKLAEATEPGSTIFASVQALGLKLEARKAPVPLIVVDHVEKSPTEN